MAKSRLLIGAFVIALTSSEAGGTTVGPELVPDPEFDDPTSWDTGIGASTVQNGHLIVINHSGLIFPVPQLSTRIGASYQYSLVVDLVNNPSSGGKVTLGGQTLWVPGDSTGTFSGTVVAADTGGLVFNFLDPYLGRAEFDLVSVAIVIPVPPALWLFGSGLFGLLGVARKNASRPTE